MGVLLECLKCNCVARVTSIQRKPSTLSHEKLTVVIHDDFTNFARVEAAFDDVHACLFCLGVSQVQVSKQDYKRIQFDMPVAAAQMLKVRSPSAAFHFVSGLGTDAKSSTFWKQTKGAAELAVISSVGAVCFRPSIVEAHTDLQPTFFHFAPSSPRACAAHKYHIYASEIARAMLYATSQGLRGAVLENAEIHALAEKFVDAECKIPAQAAEIAAAASAAGTV